MAQQMPQPRVYQSNAERQRAYRNRHRVTHQQPEPTVTVVTDETGEVAKMREELASLKAERRILDLQNTAYERRVEELESSLKNLSEDLAMFRRTVFSRPRVDPAAITKFRRDMAKMLHPDINRGVNPQAMAAVNAFCDTLK
jgi:ribosomal protein L29